MKFVLSPLASVTVALFLLSAPSSHAARLEAGIGFSHSTPQQDGIWRQDGLPHTMDLNSPALMLGVTGDALPWLRWHIDAVNLGRNSVDSWDTARDADYSPATKTCLSNCSNLAHFIGSGGVYGVSATLEAHTQGTWQFGVEAGPWVYHSSWGVSVPNYISAVGWPADTKPSDVQGWTLTSGGVERHMSSWKLGGVIGANVRYETVTLSIKKYFDGGGWPMGEGPNYDGWPPLWKNQTVVMLTKEF